MFRSITLNESIHGFPTTPPGLIAPLGDIHAQHYDYDRCSGITGCENSRPEELHACYVREMRYTRVAHTLVDAPDVLLNEEEAVLGTATTTQPHWRSNRAYRMRLHSGALHQRDSDREFIGILTDRSRGRARLPEALGGLPEA
ncbi:hypothetical protein EDB89DRAFT_1905210 [Lactarius sanguifluus]|nr:hypothetical protein EDB89DRAFT_1905210 [Lactarius sanguifluus]